MITKFNKVESQQETFSSRLQSINSTSNGCENTARMAIAMS